MTTANGTTTRIAKASFGTRALALLIDVLGLVIVETIIASILYGGNLNGPEPFGLIVALAYFVYFWSASGGGQTLGMKSLSIKVVRADGSMLDHIGAFIRFGGFVVSCVALFIGLIWAAFDAQGQGWHDKIAGTYVVRA